MGGMAGLASQADEQVRATNENHKEDFILKSVAS